MHKSYPESQSALCGWPGFFVFQGPGRAAERGEATSVPNRNDSQVTFMLYKKVTSGAQSIDKNDSHNITKSKVWRAKPYPIDFAK